MHSRPQTSLSSSKRGFTLLELLSVVAIMAIVMGLLGLSLRSMQGPSTQVAATQVASALSLARQIAISRNADTRFVIYGRTNATTANDLPAESWRYWTVVMTNKDMPNPEANVWIMQREWEKLPEGTVFLDVAAGAYGTINESPISATVGIPFAPVFQLIVGDRTQSWKGFASFGTFNISSPDNPDISFQVLTEVPAIGYKSSGEAVECRGVSSGSGLGNHGVIAVRVADGVSTDEGQIVLRSTNNYYYIETDRFGRVRVRARESFR
jgi:prepilin-type N-terminal cleavage/methylation domain-containing protein